MKGAIGFSMGEGKEKLERRTALKQKEDPAYVSHCKRGGYVVTGNS
jgi:hypothetical protein